MILPKFWGHGQLFAFSALDGTSYASDDFTGMLSGDKIGIRFFSKVKRELMLVNVRGRFMEFDAVTSDYIRFHFPQQDALRIIYAAQHLIIGNVAGEIFPVVLTEGAFQQLDVNGVQVQDTLNGEFTALKFENGRFAFAYGHSAQEAAALAEKGLAMNIDEVEAAKLAFYESHAAPDDFRYASLYMKCLSVLKTQLYSPEAEFDTIWSTPDRLPHKHLWLWDSVFHALGHRHIDTKLGESLIHAIWAHQHEDGFVPHMMDVHESSDITQPPIIAWGAWQVYQTSGNRDFLCEAYENNKRFLAWCRANRRLSEKELYTWNTTSDVNCRCDECGMDNSPRFDVKAPLFAIDFCCFMANDVRWMRRIAEELGRSEDAAFYQDWFEQIARDVNACLWSEEDSFYFDYNVPADHLHKVWAVSSFLPLWSGICSPEQAQKLVAHLQDPETFGTPFPIPTVSQQDETFGSDMWRGPVWINYNYMIAEGLTAYGFGDYAGEIIEKTLYYMNYWYQSNGLIYEFYDSSHKKAPSKLNRKGSPFEPYNIDIRLQTIRDYGWSCTLLFDLLHQQL